MNGYGELLKDPRWQKKRLEIMQRDNFTCRFCGNSGETLNVHHQYYLHGPRPWEYGNDLLITLCETCHRSEEQLKQYDEELLKSLLALGCSRKAIHGHSKILFELLVDADANKKLSEITDIMRDYRK